MRFFLIPPPPYFPCNLNFAALKLLERDWELNLVTVWPLDGAMVSKKLRRNK